MKELMAGQSLKTFRDNVAAVETEPNSLSRN